MEWDIVPSLHLARAAPSVAALPPAVAAVVVDLLYDGLDVAGADVAAAVVAEPGAAALAVVPPFCTPPWWLQAPFPPLELVPSLHVTGVAPSAA